MSDAGHQVYFKGAYTYRRWRVVIAGLAASGIALFVFAWLVIGLRKTEWSLKVAGMVIFVGGIGFLLGWAGWSLLKSWLQETAIKVEISDAGIRQGDEFADWERIEWVWGSFEGKRFSFQRGHRRVQLFYQRKGVWWKRMDRPIWTDQGLSEEEYDQLMRKLDEAVGVKFGHVSFG